MINAYKNNTSNTEASGVLNNATIVRERECSDDDYETHKGAFGKWFDEQDIGASVMGSDGLQDDDDESGTGDEKDGDKASKKRKKLKDGDKPKKKQKLATAEEAKEDEDLKALLGIEAEEAEDPLEVLIKTSKSSLKHAHGICLKMQEQIAVIDSSAGSIEQATKKSFQDIKSLLERQMKVLGKALFNKKIEIDDFQMAFDEHKKLLDDAVELLKTAKSVSNSKKDEKEKKNKKDEKDSKDKRHKKDKKDKKAAKD